MTRIYTLIFIMTAIAQFIAHSQTSYDYDHNRGVRFSTKSKYYSHLYNFDFMRFRSFDSIRELLNMNENNKYYFKNSDGRPTAKPVVLNNPKVRDNELMVVRYSEAKPLNEKARGAKTIEINRYKIGGEKPIASKTYYSINEFIQNYDNDNCKQKAYIDIVFLRDWMFENIAESKMFNDLTVNVETGQVVYGRAFVITIVYTSQRYTPLPKHIRDQLVLY